ncbi:MAG: Uma2 family endonuclease [Deltaproteobacteria bacterium]|nr:Uma2 family endonuclease [Deltaproteobacteria bacterium]
MTTAKGRLTVEEYLVLEEAAVERHEFFRGEILAMSGGTANHALVAMNVGVALNLALRGRPCRVMGADMRIGVVPDDLFTHPDVVVVSGEPRFRRPQQTTLLNPSLIVEVLSPSTERHDRGFKRFHYQQVESLREYLLVPQQAGPVEHFSRDADGSWRARILRPNGPLRLPGLDVEVRLEDFFLNLVAETPDA